MNRGRKGHLTRSLEMESCLRTFDADPENIQSANQWTRWLETFNDHVAELEIKGGKLKEGEKLRLLLNHVSCLVYQYVMDCTDFEDSVDILSGIYGKTMSKITTREAIAKRTQHCGESVEEYAQALIRLSDNCEFETISAEQNKETYLKKTFIDGLKSGDVKMELERMNNLPLKAAIEYAKSAEQSKQCCKRSPQQPTSGPNSRFFGLDLKNNRQKTEEQIFVRKKKAQSDCSCKNNHLPSSEENQQKVRTVEAKVVAFQSHLSQEIK